MNKSLDKRQTPYPKYVLHKRVKFLTLNEQESKNHLIKTRVTSLNENQYEAITFLINNKDELNSWEKTKLKDLYKSLNANKLRYDLRSKTVSIGKIKIKLDDILIIDKSEKCTLNISKHLKYKIIRENKYWYNYGGEFYDYFGTGLQEVSAAWKTILQIISCDDYCLIFKVSKKLL